MCEIREKIKHYLQSKKKLDQVAHYVYVKDEDIRIAAKHYGVKYIHLQRKVDIIKKLFNDFKLECAFQRAVQNVLNENETVTEAATHYKLDPTILSAEINQFKKLGKKSYVCNKLINVNTGVFTFDEELLLLKNLSKKKKSLSCDCQICAMELLLYIAYEFAQKENKQYPKEWNEHKRADEKWLIDFEMIHGIRLLMFSYKCKKELSQSLNL